MYYIFVENNKINGCGTCKCSNNEISNFEVSKEIFENYKKEPLKYIFEDNKIIENPNIEKERQQTQNIQNLENLKYELNELDKKRIRAICEKGIKDTSTGQTWLEFYNQKVVELRNKINNLS